MVRLLGALLLVGGGLALGLGAAGELARRARDLETWQAALALMERELAFRLPDTDRLLEKARRQGRDPAAQVFAEAQQGLERLGEEPFEAIWAAALKAHPGALAPEDLDLLSALGPVLGAYGGEDQKKAAEELRRALAERSNEVRERLGREGKVYGAAGLAAGAFLVILLL